MGGNRCCTLERIQGGDMFELGDEVMLRSSAFNLRGNIQRSVSGFPFTEDKADVWGGCLPTHMNASTVCKVVDLPSPGVVGVADSHAANDVLWYLPQNAVRAPAPQLFLTIQPSWENAEMCLLHFFCMGGEEVASVLAD